MLVCVCQLLSRATPWAAACQAPLSMGFSRQGYWSDLPFPSPGNLPDPGIEPRSPALQADSLPTALRRKSQYAYDGSHFFGGGCVAQLVGSQFPNQEWNLCPPPPPAHCSGTELPTVPTSSPHPLDCQEIPGDSYFRENKTQNRDLPSDPVAKTLHSQCRGSKFDTWLGNLIPQAETKDPMYCN